MGLVIAAVALGTSSSALRCCAARAAVVICIRRILALTSGEPSICLCSSFISDGSCAIVECVDGAAKGRQQSYCCQDEQQRNKQPNESSVYRSRPLSRLASDDVSKAEMAAEITK